MRGLFVALLAIGCGPPPRDGTHLAPDAPPTVQIDATVDQCPPPPSAGPEVALAAPFDTLYHVYDLGPIPGVPSPLGGTVISPTDPDVLLVAGASESANGAIYSIGVTRDACGHITGFAGTASYLASTPYVDANLVFFGNDLLVYTEWPQYTLSQLRMGTTMPARRDDLRAFGTPAIESSPGGLGRVPANLATAGELRLVTWPQGGWYHAHVTPDQGLVTLTGLTHATTLAHQPGGFAYVPQGSPGFAVQSLIVAEWTGTPANDRVAVYEVDAQGDPIVATRKEFFAQFPRPWGAYFEPITGDYMFLSWGTAPDRLYIVQGFAPPVLL
jgi:hypothetical protein